MGGDEIEVSDDKSSNLEEYWSDKEETAKIFKIETDIFDYETPLCLAFNEFNYLLKVDPDLLTKDIIGFKTYKITKTIGSTNGTRMYHGWREDGYCNGGNLPGAYRIGNSLHYQDLEWYETLEDSELKDEALRNKAIMEGLISDDESSNDCWKRWKSHEIYYHNYDEGEYDNETHEEGQYVAVKEDEYDDLIITSEEACRAYQEIFRMMDEGWMVTRTEFMKTGVKGSSSSNQNSQNVAFVSSNNNGSSNQAHGSNSANTNSMSDAVIISSLKPILTMAIADLRAEDSYIRLEGRIRLPRAEQEQRTCKEECDKWKNRDKKLRWLMMTCESITSVPAVTTSKVKTSESKPKYVSEPLIEDWISNSEDENETWVKESVEKEKGVIDSGCSRHMTRNKSYLSDYEEIDGGFVAFRRDPKGATDENYVLLRVSRKDNMYSVDLKNIVPSEDTLLHNKAFRVVNSRTRDDALTKSMNYEPVVAGNQSNGIAGTKACENAGKARVETVPGKDYILLPFLTQDPFSSSSKDSPDAGFKPSGEEEKKDAEHLETKDSEVPNTEEPRVNQEHDEKDDEDVDAEANMTNLDKHILVSPTPTTKIHKDHPLEQIIGDIHLAPQTRRMTKSVTGHVEPKKVIQAMPDPSWIEAMQDELLQFKLQKMDVKSAFLYGKIKEEVYVCQPSGFEDLEFLDEFLQVYVDNIIFGSTKKSLCNEFEKLMHKKFQMSSMASTPMETSKPLIKDENAEDVDLVQSFQVTPKVSHLLCYEKILDYLEGNSHNRGVNSLEKIDFKVNAEANCMLPMYYDAEIDDWNGLEMLRMELGLKLGTQKVNAVGHYLATYYCLVTVGVTTLSSKICCFTQHRSLLEKSTKNADFDKIVDFLNASPIRYALTVSPTIYVSYIEQFWSTTKIKIVNNERQIRAKVNDKTIVISESSVRRDL
ncbi:hypothetical protein Tco_0257496 [Tanacetum coccineum]